MAVRDEDVARLDVAMHDATLVCIGERIGDLARDVERIVEWKLLLALEACGQRLAFDIRRDVILEPTDASRVEDRENVRMLEARSDLNLALEACVT